MSDPKPFIWDTDDVYQQEKYKRNEGKWLVMPVGFLTSPETVEKVFQVLSNERGYLFPTSVSDGDLNDLAQEIAEAVLRAITEDTE